MLGDSVYSHVGRDSETRPHIPIACTCGTLLSGACCMHAMQAYLQYVQGSLPHLQAAALLCKQDLVSTSHTWQLCDTDRLRVFYIPCGLGLGFRPKP